MRLALYFNGVWHIVHSFVFVIYFEGEHYNRRGRFLKMERFPDHPGNRIYFSTLSQYPRGKVNRLMVQFVGPKKQKSLLE